HAVIGLGNSLKPREELRSNAGETRRGVWTEQVADLVGSLEIESHQIGPLSIVKLPSQPLRSAGGGHDAGPRAHGIGRAPRGRGGSQAGAGSIDEVTGQVGRAHDAIPRGDALDRFVERLRVANAAGNLF